LTKTKQHNSQLDVVKREVGQEVQKLSREATTSDIMEKDVSLADIRKETRSHLVLNTSDSSKMKLMMREVHDIINSTQQLRIRNSRMLVHIILLKRGNMYKMPILQHTSDNGSERMNDAPTQHRDDITSRSLTEQREDERRPNTASRRRHRAMDAENNDDHIFEDMFRTLNTPDENLKKLLIIEAIKQATRTKRPDGTHQAAVCVVCDRVIIGDEKVCNISQRDLRKIDTA